MKKYIFIILFLIIGISFAKENQYRKSYSQSKQADIVKKQGGVIIRLNHIQLGDLSWVCDEIWVKENTDSLDVAEFLKTNITTDSKVLVPVLENYAKTIVVKKTKSLEERVKILEAEVENLKKTATVIK